MTEQLVITFLSTHDALAAEECCRQSGVPGRLIPLPPDINADCGLAWRMPPDPEAEAAFDRAVGARLKTGARIKRAFLY